MKSECCCDLLHVNLGIISFCLWGSLRRAQGEGVYGGARQMRLITCVSVVIMNQLWYFHVISLIRRQLFWIYSQVTACYCLFVLGVNQNSLIAECSSSGAKEGVRRSLRHKNSLAGTPVPGELLLQTRFWQ